MLIHLYLPLNLYYHILYGKSEIKNINTRAQINFQYRDQTWFSMHECLPGPEEDIENHGRRPRFSTSFEGPGKR